MSNCLDPKHTCGETLSSACVDLQIKHQFESFDESTLNCDPNINDLFKKFDKVLKNVQSEISLLDINKKDLIFDEKVIKINGLIELLISIISDLKLKTNSLQDQINDINVLNEQINIDLSCLGVASCDGNTSNNHSILFIITTLVSAYCNLKSKIEP